MRNILTVLFMLSSLVYSKEYTIIKTSCIQQSEHSGKTLDQQKQILINQAKNLALTDLYGEIIFSSTEVSNGKLISDDIKSKAIGAVRIKGIPNFYNGKNFGEVCADIKAYVTDKDINKYSPKEVKLNKYCFNNTNVQMNKIKQEAKYGAYIEIISQYKPSLKLTGIQAEKLIHGFKISNDNFDFDTASYCFDAVATILPYELEIDNISKTVVKKVKVEKPYRNNKTNMVYDKANNLMWQDDKSRDEWASKLERVRDERCGELKLNGYNDWRLPSIKELEISDSYYRLFKHTEDERGYSVGAHIYWSNTYVNPRLTHGLDPAFSFNFKKHEVQKFKSGVAYLNYRCVRNIKKVEVEEISY